jgi:hypothetical protein
VIAVARELDGSRGALLERFIAVALQHQGGGTPDIDLGYHAGHHTLAVDERLTPIIARLAKLSDSPQSIYMLDKCNAVRYTSHL